MSGCKQARERLLLIREKKVHGDKQSSIARLTTPTVGHHGVLLKQKVHQPGAARSDIGPRRPTKASACAVPAGRRRDLVKTRGKANRQRLSVEASH